RRLVWKRGALWPFVITGFAETAAIFTIITALSVGAVSVIAPIATTYPLWSMIGAAIFLRDAEKITALTVVGTLSVVAGTVAVILNSGAADDAASDQRADQRQRGDGHHHGEGEALRGGKGRRRESARAAAARFDEGDGRRRAEGARRGADRAQHRRQ